MQHIRLFTLTLIFTALAPFLANAGIPQQPTEVNPVEVGSTVPDISLTSADGQTVSLREMVSEQATVIIFYRGSWCPYCTKHLAAVGQVEDTLLEKGYRIIAISPDRIEKVAEATQASDFNYKLYSDSLLEAATAFGLTFQIDRPMREKLLSYRIDIQAAFGQKHYLMPVPAAYIVGTDGVITFRHFNPDYTKRLTADDILAALE